MSKVSLFGELQRRNVHRAAVFYAGVAWLLVQVATQVFPFFHIDDSVVRWIVIAVVVGFPFALLFSWFYEWTPQGIKLESEIEGDTSVTRQTGKRLDRWIIGLLGIAVLLLLANTLTRHPSGSVDVGKSIAVLPLVNESGDPANEYFSDGLSEELIAALAQIGDLKVIGRSSSFRFRGKDQDDTASIGAKLGVATLLEGTVRKQGDQVRIVAELINAMDGRALWSRTYNRDLKDIFSVQSEIAQAVALSLKSTLFAKEMKPVAAMTPINVEAHNAYLQGHFYFLRGNVADFRVAVGHYDETIRLDPEYAMAYAERSEAWTWIADQDPDRRIVPEAWAAARRDAEKAVAVDPELAEAHAALGWVRFFSEWNFDEGLVELRRAEQLSPHNATVQNLLARVLIYMGRYREAERVARQSVELDPLLFSAYENLARILFCENRLGEADTMARKGAELQPNASASHRWQVFVAIFRHEGDIALAEAQKEPGEGYRAFLLALAQSARGDRSAADAALKALISFGHDGLAYQIAQVYAWRGETDSAFDWLQHAYDQHDTGILSLPIDPLLKSLHNDPRYAALLAKLGLPSPEKLST